MTSKPPVDPQMIQWVITGLEPRATLFHLGQYCGSWQASTQGKSIASFHLVLQGQCYLHFETGSSLLLQAGEGIFLLKDLPHRLTPFADPQQTTHHCKMQPLLPAQTEGTGLACGFFELGGRLATALLASLPDWLLLKREQTANGALHSLFELLLKEATEADHSATPLIERLTELLFFYLIRDGLKDQPLTPGIWALACHPQFSTLIRQLLDQPAHHWTLAEMAATLHQSRASFIRHFMEVSDCPPAQLLMLLRMQLAAQQLKTGQPVGQVAETVGYQSAAAFSRAFSKVFGTSPGHYARRFIP